MKGSGQALGTIRAEGFAKIDRAALAALWTRDFSSDKDEREKQVLGCLLVARLPGEEDKRPSVETLLHDLMPFAYVVHTYPNMVNALTCARGGRAAFDRIGAVLAAEAKTRAQLDAQGVDTGDEVRFLEALVPVARWALGTEALFSVSPRGWYSTKGNERSTSRRASARSDTQPSDRAWTMRLPRALASMGPA